MEADVAEYSNIEWTDATWNPVTGCSIASPGCNNCYAMQLAGTRLQHHPSRAGLTKMVKGGKHVWTGEVRFNEQWLTQPLHWRRPRMIFVCAHGDLFHENVPWEWLDQTFDVMERADWHTYQVLTKRSAEMLAYIKHRYAGRTPPKHIWLGVSAERQKEADERIPDLLATPAAVRFVSLEPLLGPIDLTHIRIPLAGASYMTRSALEATDNLNKGAATPGRDQRLDWIILGGESGDGARPFDIDWARSILRQCKVAGVPAFMKQLGSNPYSDGRPMHAAPRGKYGDPAGWPPELRVREMPNVT
jgi:protein gp37